MSVDQPGGLNPQLADMRANAISGLDHVGALITIQGTPTFRISRIGGVISAFFRLEIGQRAKNGWQVQDFILCLTGVQSSPANARQWLQVVGRTGGPKLRIP